MTNQFDRVSIATAVEQMYPVKMGLVNLFFEGKEEFPTDTKTVEVDVYTDKRRVANYVKRGMGSTQVEDIGFKVVDYRPPLIDISKTTDAFKLFERDFGKTFLDTAPDAQTRAYAKLGRDFEELKTIAQRMALKQVADVLTTGKITVDESGVSRVIDFDMRNDHKITLSGTSLWSDVSSDPIADIRNWQNKIGEDSGLFPDALILGKNAKSAFFAHPKVQKYYDNRRIIIGEMKAKRLENGLVELGEIEGTTIYEFNEWFFNESTNTNEAIIDPNKVILGSTNAKVSVHYAGLEDSDDGSVFIVAQKELAKTYVDTRKNVMEAIYKSAPLYALSQSDGFLNVVVV